MKVFAVLGGVLCVSLALAQSTAAVQDRTGGFGLNSAYNKLWNSGSTITINGTVTGKLTLTPFKGMGDAVVLEVKQTGKPAYEVHLGPVWFASNLPTKINVKDKVVVTGSRTKLNDKTIVMARSVIVGKREVFFRDKAGTPLWITARANSAAPTDSELQGEIVNREIVNIGGMDYNVYRIETGTGTVDIVGEPTWLANRQTYSINVGYNVQIVGALRPATQVGYNLFWADSLYTGGTTIFLRPPGW